MERVPKRRKSSQWKKANILKLLPSSLKEAMYISSWKKCYSKHDVNSCMSKIQKTSFGEKLVGYLHFVNEYAAIHHMMHVFSLLSSGLSPFILNANGLNPNPNNPKSTLGFKKLDLGTKPTRLNLYPTLRMDVMSIYKLAQKSFASPGKKCSTSKTEDIKIILFTWPYALEC